MMLSHQRKYLLPASSIFLLLASLFASVTSQQIWTRTVCFDRNGNYSSNSIYRTNLGTLLSSLSANVGINGFYNASVGEIPNRVYAIALCRGDVQLDFCRSCIQIATVDILPACPYQMQVLYWHEFCMMRYSNDSSIMETMVSTPDYMLESSPNSARPDEYMSDVGTLAANISRQASNGGSLWKVAYGSRPSVLNRTIYVLGQCTPDLSAEDCSSCLSIAASKLNRTTYGSLGARIYQPSCNLRYELNSFYNETRIQELPNLPRILPPVASPPAASPPAASTLPGNGNNSDSNTTRTIIVVVSIVVGVVILILIGFLIWRAKQKKPMPKEGGQMDDSIIESLQYEFSVIKVATNDFSEVNKLGQGGFGAVYKGKLPTGEEIAVKRLSIGSGQGDLEFKNEVMLLVKLQHRNLVRLIGFSIEGLEKLLVYEFVQNASLDQFLFDPAKRSQLDWDTRYKIIGGIARGILYLHEDSRLRIIHRDLKSSNVLLDGEMNPKIADFGMARLFVQNETQGDTSRIVGTYGYMAPEYATRGLFSVKSDVFSFGVLVLEIISGERIRFGTKEDLISRAWENWRRGAAESFIDPVLMCGANTPEQILKCMHISLLCIQHNVPDRPAMATIVTVLSTGMSMNLPLPVEPVFYEYDDDDYNSTTSLLPGDINLREGNYGRLATENERAESGALNI